MSPVTRYRSSLARFLTGVAAGLVLLTLVVGVPAALLLIAPLGLPATWPSWDQLGAALLRPDDGRLALGALRLVAWGAWAAFTWAVATEAAAAIRGRDAHRVRLLGGFQRVAATLVGAALLTLTAPTAIPPVAVGQVSISQAAEPASPPGVPSSSEMATRSDPAPDPPATTGNVAPTTVTVRVGDSLWALAQEHLADGQRWDEFYALNAGRTQADGRALTDPDQIDVGWELAIPGTAAEPGVAATVPGLFQVAVEPGDSLSALAATHLGDPERYPEIFALNAGVEQPDGDMLTDPDLIRPGWILSLPARSSGSAEAPAPGPVVPITEPAPVTPDSTTPTPHSPSLTPDLGAAPDVVEPSPGPTRHLLDPTPDRTRAEAVGRPAPVSDQAPNTTSASVPTSSDATQELYLGLTALAAAGLVGELTRRRLLQRRTRRTGERILRPTADSPADRAERQMRTAPTPLSLAQVRTVFDVVTAACYAAERDLPRVGAVEVTPERMILHLTEDDLAPIAPFTATDHPRRWSAPTATLATLAAPDPEGLAPEPYPTLVALGHTESGTVLLNLEAAGTLRLLGDPEAAAGALRAVVAELATSDLSARAGISAGGEFTALAHTCAPSRLQAGTGLPSPQLDVRRTDVGAALTESGLDDTLQARSDRAAPDLWLPVVYADEDSSTLCAPWSGSVLLTRATGSGGWQLNVDADGSATVLDLNLSFRASRLTPDGLACIADLLAPATPTTPAPPIGLPTPAIEEAAATLASLGPLDGSTPSDSAGPGMRVNVLGPVRLTNLPPGQPYPTPQKVELIAFLALRGPSGKEIDEALWPGQRDREQARYQVAHKARLCVTELNLPSGRRGKPIALAPIVTCDWDDFRRLAARGLAAGPSGIEDLRAALGLVRGRPLAGVDDGGYGWADRDADAMIAAITDVAHTLARLLIEAGDSRASLSAATIGLTIDPVNDRLRDDAIAAALACGDVDQAQRIKLRHDALLADLDDEFV